MPVLVLDLLKYAFLVVLYIFVWRAVRAVYVELRPERTGAAPVAKPSRARKGKGKPATTVVVIDGKEHKGSSFDVTNEMLVGRSEECTLTLDDSYVSTRHARIFNKDGTLILEDLGSTNGTYLNRRRISTPTELHRGDRIKIGRTVMEMKK